MITFVLSVIIGIPIVMFLIAFLCCFRSGWKNPIRTIWKARKVFKRPSLYIYFGKYNNWENYFDIDTFIFSLYSSDVIWKDKYNTPRLEFPPKINIVFFKFIQLHIYFSSPESTDSEDEYFEQMIWYLDYANQDLSRAIETWPWTKWDNENESTWNNKFLKQ